MPSPVIPSEFCDIVPAPTDSVCSKLAATVLQLPQKICDFFTWMLASDGELSEDFKADIRGVIGSSYVTAGGSAGVITAAPDPAFASLDDLHGVPVIVKAIFTNTGTVTLNLNSLGAKTIYKFGLDPLEAGDITPNMAFIVVYDSTADHFKFLGGVTVVSVPTTTDLLISDELSISYASPVQSVAHLLDGTPTSVRAVVICKTSEFGYSVDDEVDMASLHCDSLFAPSVWANATHVGVVFKNPITLITKSTGGAANNTLTAANWRIKFYAEYTS